MRGRLRVTILLGIAVGVITYAGFSGGWLLVERSSWIVIVLGLPLAVYQLWLLQSDQTRIAKELSRKPLLRTGFDLTKDRKDVVRTMQVSPIWPIGATASQSMSIHITTKNFGTKTAHDVLENLIIPESLAGILAAAAVQRHGEPERRPFLVREKFDLNPGDVMVWELQMPLPKGSPVLEVVVSISMLDTEETIETLELHIEGY